jgi:5-methylthioadenosine/S-adenosylhomocysteine deaminase
MMDKGEDVPGALHEETDQSIKESLALLDAWHGQAQGRIRYCFAPRFALSCTTALLSEVAKLARERGVIIHTHASENRNECAIVEQETGLSNIAYLDSAGVAGSHVVLAHCVHLNEGEFASLATKGTNVAHCPSSNLKLGSGIAPITTMLERGISVSLGADGAACNNRLDMFTEMRTMTLLQKALHGPEVIPARQALRIATIEGARSLGLAGQIGSLEVGKRADVTIVSLNGLHAAPISTDLVSSLVYSAQASDVQSVIVDGQVLMENRKLLTINSAELLQVAHRERDDLVARAGIQLG